MRKYLRKIPARNYVIIGLVIVIYLCNKACTDRPSTTATAPIRNSYGQAFAGSAACSVCHQNIYQGHIHTAHYLDSRPASEEYIKGSFDSGRNRFVYQAGMEVRLERKDGHFFQTAFLHGKEYRRESFDIVIGSGRKGQTYLYWNDGKLFQLPISYFSVLQSWCNSPGYSDSAANFDRRVPATCLECHTTYARTVFRSSADRGDIFDKDQIVYGIDCEKCHGPGAQHIAFHTEHPEEKKGGYITNTRLLSRQQRLDACALCHSGSRSQRMPAFSFQPGDTLDNFSTARYFSDSTASLDVHGNQYGLLTSSKCFRSSQMDCSSCHNVHVNEAGDPKLFSQRCMTCHSPAGAHFCRMAATVDAAVLAVNCIDCHMPSLPSQKILLTMSNAGRTVHNLVRTHRIAIYPEIAKEYLEKLRQQ